MSNTAADCQIRIWTARYSNSTSITGTERHNHHCTVELESKSEWASVVVMTMTAVMTTMTMSAVLTAVMMIVLQEVSRLTLHIDTATQRQRVKAMHTVMYRRVVLFSVQVSTGGR